MMIISKIRKLDARMINNFKKAYTDSRESGLTERIQMTTMGVICLILTILFTVADKAWQLALIFSGISSIYIAWAFYSWRVFFILRKEGFNPDEPLFIYGPVSLFRICFFITAFIVLIAFFLMPRIFTTIFGFSDDSFFRPVYVLYSISIGIVTTEYWRYFFAVKNWSTRRHFVYVLLITIMVFAFISYTTPMHRPPHFIDFE